MSDPSNESEEVASTWALVARESEREAAPFAPSPRCRRIDRDRFDLATVHLDRQPSLRSITE